MATIDIEVIAPVVSGTSHCQHCQIFIDDAGVGQQVDRDEMSTYPQEMWEDYARLSDLVRDLSARYGRQLRFRIIDPHTPAGFWKSLRHWVRTYPTFIVNGQTKCTGWDRDTLETLLRARGATPAPASS